MEWQPIETAPKDGGYIIAGLFRGRDELIWVKHSRWITAAEIAASEWCDEDECEGGWMDGNYEDELCGPTHWMALPAPPASPQSDNTNPA